jgi:hypothetical protein
MIPYGLAAAGIAVELYIGFKPIGAGGKLFELLDGAYWCSCHNSRHDAGKKSPYA